MAQEVVRVFVDKSRSDLLKLAGYSILPGPAGMDSLRVVTGPIGDLAKAIDAIGGTCACDVIASKGDASTGRVIVSSDQLGGFARVRELDALNKVVGAEST